MAEASGQRPHYGLRSGDDGDDDNDDDDCDDGDDGDVGVTILRQ